MPPGVAGGIAPRFWRLVERLAPGNAQPRAWLDRHRARLLAYG